MNIRLTLSALFLSAVFLAVMLGCGGSDESNSVQNGKVSLYLTDGPGEYKAVYITIKALHIRKSSGEWRHIASLNKTFDLLSLRNGIRASLGLSDLPEGEYTQLRLLLSVRPDKEKNLLNRPHPYGNYLILNDNTLHELKIPSAIQSGIKLIGNFTVFTDETTVITLDFDADKSITEASSGQWLLKPVIKIIPEEEFENSVMLSGTVKESSGGVLKGVKVSLQKSVGEEIEREALAFSDANGSFQFHVNAQEYILVAYKEGYLPFVADINLSRDSTVDIILPDALNTGLLTLKDISAHARLLSQNADANARNQYQQWRQY